jgi:protein SDA1
LFIIFKAGREGRAKFGKWKKEKGHAGTTNKEKLKTKNFQMLKPKLRKKQKRSFRDKQVRVNLYLLFNHIFNFFLDCTSRCIVKR